MGTLPDDPGSAAIDEVSLIGRTVGNYIVEKQLGAGGMGAVYRLKHLELPETYQALKVLTGPAGASARERFKQEALAAAKVGSHRVVKPLDIGQFDDGLPYIVLEYVAGRSLEQQLAEQGPMHVETALRIATRVADTMVIAHREAIVHRDLKPGNLMLVPEGEGDYQVKLLDFGIARASGEIKLARTAESVVMGTPGYWSPEAVAGGVVDGRTDVFSLGVILFQMLTGELPFPAGNVQAAMMAVLSDAPAPSASSRRRREVGPVSKHVDALVARALAKDRDERFDMIGLHQALLDALGRSGNKRPAPPPSVVLAVRPSRSDAPTISPSNEKPRLFRATPRTTEGAADPPHAAPEAPSTDTALDTSSARRTLPRLSLVLAAVVLTAASAGLTLAFLPRHKPESRPLPAETAPTSTPTPTPPLPPTPPAGPPLQVPPALRPNPGPPSSTTLPPVAPPTSSASVPNSATKPATPSKKAVGRPASRPAAGGAAKSPATINNDSDGLRAKEDI